MQKIELHTAWQWDCPECGVENLERAVTVEMSQEDREEMMEEHGLEPGVTGDWTTQPDEVTCKSCNREFETINPNDESDEWI